MFMLLPKLVERTRAVFDFRLVIWQFLLKSALFCWSRFCFIKTPAKFKKRCKLVSLSFFFGHRNLNGIKTFFLILCHKLALYKLNVRFIQLLVNDRVEIRRDLLVISSNTINEILDKNFRLQLTFVTRSCSGVILVNKWYFNSRNKKDFICFSFVVVLLTLLKKQDKCFWIKNDIAKVG